MKVALVYDRINKIGGAEQILINLSEIWPEATWFTSLHNPKLAPFSSDWTVKSSILSSIPYLRDHHDYIPFLMPSIFESFDLSGYDLVISVSSEAAKSVITTPHTLHVNYCLTPTRYLYSHRSTYLNSLALGYLSKPIRKLASSLIDLLTKWDGTISNRPDTMISISKLVKTRVNKYYNRTSEVIYPPVDTDKFTPTRKVKKKEYYLIVSRLVPYKNIDKVIKAFSISGKKLIIIGDGSESTKLRKISTRNITFLGLVSDHELVNYMREARGFIQANEEDFGIAMVESLASGTPVLAYNKGGAREIITAESGLLFDDSSVSGIMQSVNNFERIKFSSEHCINRARKFDKKIFKQKFRKAIEREWQKKQKTLNS